MQIKSIINWASLLTLTILGAIMGAEYTDKLHLLALGGIIAYAIVVQVQITTMDRLEGELGNKEKVVGQLNLKLSTILFQSNLGVQNRMYLAVHPIGGGDIRINVPFEVKVCMNAPFEINSPPDLKLITKQRWGYIEIGGRRIPSSRYGDDWEYILSSSLFLHIENTNNKFFSVEFSVNLVAIGIHEFTLEAKAANFHSKISNNFESKP